MKKTCAWLLSILCCLGTLPIFLGCKKIQNAHTRYEIIAEYVPENNMLTGALKVTFENPTDNEMDVLKFQLYPNAYRKGALCSPIRAADKELAYPKGESYGEMVISSVNGGKNWEIMGEDQNILYVFLEKPLYPTEKVVLDIGFTTKFAFVNHRTGVTDSVVNLGNFFPVLCGIKNGGFYETLYYSLGDPFYLDAADYKLTLTLPKEYTVASTGEQKEERMLESKKVHTMYATNVRDFAVALSKKYRFVTDMVGGKTLFYYYYRDKEPSKTFSVMKEAFSYFEKTFGTYPYPVCTLAETSLCTNGVAYPAFLFLSETVEGEKRIETVVHSMAHQWWGCVVGSDQIENAWQDEGLAAYSTLLFYEANEKYEKKREELVTAALKEYRSYYDVYGSVLGRTDTNMQRHLKDYVNEYEYRCLAYHKGLIMLDTLRKSVGDHKFFLGLKKYYVENRYAQATPEHLIAAFERVGLDVRGFFESFLQGKTVL